MIHRKIVLDFIISVNIILGAIVSVNYRLLSEILLKLLNQLRILDLLKLFIFELTEDDVSEFFLRSSYFQTTKLAKFHELESICGFDTQC